MDKEEKPLLPQDGQKKREEKKAWLQAMYMALGVLFLIGIWDLIWSLANKAFPEFFYTIGQMFILMGQPSVWEALGLSVGRIIITLAIVTVLGSLLGLLSAFFHPLEEILKPFIYFLTAFPTASMIYVLIIYTKITDYLLVAFLTFPIIYKAVLSGGKRVMEKYSDPLRIDGSKSPRAFFSVLLPLSIPYIFLGLAQADGLALKAEIMAEVFISDFRYKGIGVLIRNAATVEANLDTLFGLTMLAILTMSLVDLGMYFAKRALANRYGTEPVKVFRLY